MNYIMYIELPWAKSDIYDCLVCISIIILCDNNLISVTVGCGDAKLIICTQVAIFRKQYFVGHNQGWLPTADIDRVKPFRGIL